MMIFKKVLLVLKVISSQPGSALISAIKKRLRKAARTIQSIPAILPAIAKTKNASRRNKPDSKTVVFVCQYPRGREAKLAHGLKSAGWKVVLLYASDAAWDMKPYFDETRRFKNKWEALSIACDYSPQAYHVFSLMGDETAVAFMRYKPGKVIFDTNDMIEGMIVNPWFTGDLDRQRYCIENADALCCRDLQVQYVGRTFGYKRPKKVILFPEYCWDYPETSSPAVKRDSNEIHIVLVGNFGLEKLGEGHWGYLKIAEKFAAQKIHLHIYTHWIAVPGGRQFEEVFSDYVSLSRRTPYLHLHKPVPMDTLISEISKYDAAISVIQALIYGEEIKTHTSAHYRYCGSARISDYLDAGLPVITNKALRFQYCALSRYGVVIDSTPEVIDNMREHLQDLISPESKEKIKRLRSVYSIREHIHRLTSFYENL